jgi:hypothetical protein
VSEPPNAVAPDGTGHAHALPLALDAVNSRVPQVNGNVKRATLHEDPFVVSSVELGDSLSAVECTADVLNRKAVEKWKLGK